MTTLPRPAPVAARCPACDARGLTDVFDVRGVPVFVGILHDDADSARRAPRGDVILAWCASCGTVHNRVHDPARVHFRPGYEVSLAHSRTVRAYIEDVADRLVERYELAGRSVLEIGCGDGLFLRLLADRGIARGTGIDPTLAREGEERRGGARLRWIRDYFDPTRYPDLDPDFVASLSVFEDLSRPGEMLRGLRARLRPDARVYVEVWNALDALENDETWGIHYEQCNLFGAASLAGAFRRAGFVVLDAGLCYAGGQYCFVEAAPAGGTELDGPAPPAVATPLRIPDALARLAARHRDKVAAWAGRLAAHEAAGRRVVLWGSGGKGIGFLNGVPGADGILAVVDINPDRQGRFVPGTGHRIVSPAGAGDLAPDVAILTNVLYESEIRTQADELGMTCAFEAA